jgi:hypothetical protein
VAATGKHEGRRTGKFTGWVIALAHGPRSHLTSYNGYYVK